MSERDPWLTEKEAAKELRVSTYVVRQEREAGKLKFARIRRRVFYPMSMIEAYKQAAICQQSDSGSTQAQADTTSRGPSGAVRDAHQLARKIAGRLNASARLSS
jgi:hypothetical protein